MGRAIQNALSPYEALDPEVDDPTTGTEDPEGSDVPDSDGPSRQEIRESILLSVKNALGITPDQHPFDEALIMHINTNFGTLHQLGIGPGEPFTIDGDSQLWSDFVCQVNVEMVRTYMYLQTKLYFDPPTVATLYDAISRQLQELVWRLRVAGDEDHVNKFGDPAEEGVDESAYRSGQWYSGI